MITTTNIGSKNVVSKDILESKIPIFTTQKKRILEFAKENQIPSKFVIPLFKKGTNTNHRSSVAEDYITLEQLLQTKLDSNVSISSIVDSVHDKYPTIAEKEILYAISNLVELTPNFYKQAEMFYTKYKDPESFENEKINFENTEIPSLIERDKKDLKQIQSFFKNIVKNDPVLTSDMTITKMTVEFDVKTPENENLLQMAPDLFANMALNFEVPYVQYNDQRFTKYKVFNGDTFETRPPFKIFQDRFNKFDEKNMIYMIVFADEIVDFTDFTKNSFISAEINLEKSTLSFKYLVLDQRPEKEIVKAIQSIFPTLQFKNKKEKNYGANFNVYYSNIKDDWTFLDLLLTEPFQEDSKNLFSSLLFVDEFDKPVSEKKKLKLYYDTNIAFETPSREEDLSKIASLGFYMTQYVSGVNDRVGRYVITSFDRQTKTEDKIIGVKETPFQSLLLEKNTPYIKVNISKAVNKFVLFQFMNIFARLLNIYNTVKGEYENIYENLIPELKDVKVANEVSLIVNPEKDEKEKRTKKVNLKTIAPEIFTESYSRDCQFKYQPIIISENEVDYWKNQKVLLGKKMVERPVKQLGDYLFVCHTNDRPFVEFKQNLDEDRVFPNYPCCYTEPQKEVRERKRGSTYRSKDPIKTNKVMAEGGLAILPTPIDDMIKGVFEKEVNLFRMGTIIGPNSFLACICLALQDKQFMKLNTIQQKESYLLKIKKAIADTANFNVTSSELFDISEKERLELFMRQDDFLDPALFYRVVEEVFGLNIFVFSASLPKPNVEPIYSLEISRFSSVPMHSYRKGLPTMLVYKHWGSETDHLEYPQCELIVAGLESSDTTLFTSEMAQYLLKGYFISSEVFGKLYVPEEKYFQNYSSYTIYQLLNQDFIGNFMKEDSPVKAVGQIIDDKGKLAGIQLKSDLGRMTMGVPPLPPLDLPIIQKIHKPKLADVLKIFKDKPSGFSFENEQAVAVWFKLILMPFGVQIPIEPIDRKTIDQKYNLPEVPENRFQLMKKPSQIERLFKLQKDVNIIIQLVRWLFLIYIKEKRNLSIDDKLEESNVFIEEMFQYQSRRKDSDSSKVYDFSKLSRKLPLTNQSINKILKELEESSPTFIENQKIIISGKVFLQRIKESLEHFIRLNLQIEIPQYLDDYYLSIYDYPSIPKNIVFLSKIDFNRWIKQIKENPTSAYPVYFALRGKLYNLENPYLYAIEIEKPTTKNPFGENFLFLIQNAPYVNSLESALQNSIQWKQNKINRPEVSETDLSEFTNYKVFTIGQNEKFELVEDQSVLNRKYETIFVLQYPNVKRYASILPM